MKLIFALTFLNFGNVFAGDFNKPVVLDVYCFTQEENPTRFKLQSYAEGAWVYFADTSKTSKVFYKRRQLNVGTEGGRPYGQWVENDAFNLSIEDWDLEKAFFENSIIKHGNFLGSIQFFNIIETSPIPIACSGFVKF
jgi:hypothetical protein